jgi:hypothetical protein
VLTRERILEIQAGAEMSEEEHAEFYGSVMGSPKIAAAGPNYTKPGLDENAIDDTDPEQ